MGENQPRRYQIPTHLATPDTIDLPLLGITISLTMRQGVCFLLGGSGVFQLWQQSEHFVGLASLLVHWVGSLLLAFVTFVFAVHEIHGRHLETWIVIVARYLSRPTVCVWCRVLSEGTRHPFAEEEGLVPENDSEKENEDL